MHESKSLFFVASEAKYEVRVASEAEDEVLTASKGSLTLITNVPMSYWPLNASVHKIFPHFVKYLLMSHLGHHYIHIFNYDFFVLTISKFLCHLLQVFGLARAETKMVSTYMKI